ncbi:ABC transporter ATP-binding protein [Porphyromonas crevioricanis]|nr:ABC transporter ATP-binding protein [Porphyromonas crevioricanis]GAD07137.1 ABC transporter ATP-binding protein [Porphyromonas crevioricanis JCM 13913]
MNTIQKIQSYMGQRKILLPISFALSAMNGLVSLLPFILIWFIVRELLSGRGLADSSLVKTYAWWAVGVSVIAILLYFCSLMLSHLVAFRVELNMRREAMRRVLRMPLGYFDKKLSGKIRKVIDEDTSQTHILLAHLLPDIIGSITAPLGVFILIFVFDPRLGLVCLIPILAACLTMFIMMNPNRNDFQRRYLDAQEKMSSEAVEYVRGIPVVKVFQQTVFSFKRFYDSIISYRDLVMKYTLSWQKPMSFYMVAIHSFAFFLIPVTILLIGKSDNPTELLADMFLYLLVTPLFATNIMKIMHLGQNLFLANETISRLEQLTSESSLPIAEKTLRPQQHDLAFNQVSFGYPGTTQKAVDGVDFMIPEGKTYALVGPSGSGKTTIARLIPRFWDVSHGSVRIGGVDVRDMAKEDLMERVAFVFQNTKLFKTTLRENITYGTPDATEEAINRAIDLSRSREIVDRLPNGLNTRIGADGIYLSGGERQRIALARAILKNAPIVVLDEATAFADPESETLIHQALQELMKGKTVLMIAHRLTSVQQADRILVVDKGQIAEQGNHEELLAKKGLYSSMWDEYQRSVAWTV